MTDAPFLRAILDQPADDAVRLVYADWLEEQGQPERAEFIRSQIHWQSVDHLAPAHNRTDDFAVCPCAQCLAAETWRAAMLREGQLLEEFGPHWSISVAHVFGLKHPYGDFGYQGNKKIKWNWSRGFIHSISVGTLDRFLKCAGKLFQVAPIDTVQCLDCAPLRFWSSEDPIDLTYSCRWQEEGDNCKSRWLGRIPYSVIDRMPYDPEYDRFDRDGENIDGLRVRSYASQERALAELSRALVSLGRYRPKKQRKRLPAPNTESSLEGRIHE